MFNWLGQDLTNRSCLDLFAGSGSLGFESLSRNAKSCVFVDKEKQSIINIEKNFKNFDLSNAETFLGDARDFIAKTQYQFDLVFFDPPYDSDLYDLIPEVTESLLSDKGIIYIESKKNRSFENLKTLKLKTTKTLEYGIYEKK